MPTGRALEAGRAVIKLTLSTQGFKRQMGQLHKSVGKIGRSFQSLGTLQFGGFGGGGFGAANGGFGGLVSLRNLFLGAGAGAALLWPVKLAASLEEAQAEFEALTGSAATAKMIVDEMQAFQRTAIVPVEQLQQAAAQLLGYGVTGQKVMPILKALTEISRGSGERLSRLALAYGQVRAKQRLYAQEVRQFTESGWNPLDAIIKQTGETMKEVQARMEAGGVTAAEVQNALQAAVAPGGRFFGLLDRMANTAIGQFRRLKAEIILTFRPLGEDVLPTITRFLKAINGTMDAIRNFNEANKQLFKNLFFTALAAAAALAAFVALGLTFTVLSIAASGLATAAGLVFSILGLIANPIAWLVAALGGLIVYFFKATEAGQAFAKYLGDTFDWLGRIVSATFDGIVDALVAGDLALASEVMFAGIAMAWQAGTHRLEQMWIDLKNNLAKIFVQLGYGLEKVLTKVVGNARIMLSDLTGWFADAWQLIVTRIAQIGERDDVKKELEKALLEGIAGREDTRKKDQQRIKDEMEAELNRLDTEREQIQQRIDEDRARQHADANKEQIDAQKRLNDARKKARQARRKAERNRPGRPDAPDPLDLPDLLAGSASRAPLSLLGDKRFARQILAGGQDEQVILLTKIEKNTRPRPGGLGVA